jgi:uncharacterized membrane protein YcgQ (UPF0703/DUF1980 family)
LVYRAAVDPEPVDGVPIRLVGFVIPDETIENGYRLGRFTINCCAADALLAQVPVTGSDQVHPADTWVEVVGIWDGETMSVGDARPVSLPLFRVESERQVEVPVQPYEY